jgi:hypothetical protein
MYTTMILEGTTSCVSGFSLLWLIVDSFAAGRKGHDTGTNFVLVEDQYQTQVDRLVWNFKTCFQAVSRSSLVRLLGPTNK